MKEKTKEIIKCGIVILTVFTISYCIGLILRVIIT